MGRTAESQNRTRAAAFLSEGGIFSQRLADQAFGQQRLITQLTDRIVWDKVTYRSCLCMLAAASLLFLDKELIPVCLAGSNHGACRCARRGLRRHPRAGALRGHRRKTNPLGLRERLLVMYERPRFVCWEQLREACQQIPEGSLHTWLAKLFWTLHCVHNPSHEQAHVTEDLGYRWLRYTFSEPAEVLFWDSFDTHIGEQKPASSKANWEAQSPPLSLGPAQSSSGWLVTW